MLHLIPAPLHRTLYRLADRVRRVWWRVRRPDRNTAIVLAFDPQGRVLLVRHSYGPPVWAVPGGGIGRGEDPEAAAVREFREELRCPIREVRRLGTMTRHESGSTDHLHAFVAEIAGEPAPDNREIVAAEFFDPAHLPRPADRRVARWVGDAVAFRGGESRS